MTTRHLIEGLLADTGRAKRRLSLEEVLEAGLPAVYEEYGDRLLCLDGRIFDVADPRKPAEVPLIAGGAPSEAVGVEFGWRLAGDCTCHLCSKRVTETAA